MSKTFLVRLNGLSTTSDPSSVRENLANLFHASPEQIEKILLSPGYVIKRGLSKEAAETYLTTISRAGAVCFVEEEDIVASLDIDLPETSFKFESEKENKSDSHREENIRKNTVQSDIGKVGFFRQFSTSYKAAKQKREALEQGESDIAKGHGGSSGAVGGHSPELMPEASHGRFDDIGSLVSTVITLVFFGGILYWLAMVTPIFSKYFEPSSALERITKVGIATNNDFQKFKDDGGLDASPNWHGLYVTSYKSQYSVPSGTLEAVSLGVSGKSKWSSLIDRWSVERGLSSKEVRSILSKVCKIGESQWEHTDGDLSWGTVETNTMKCSYSPGEDGTYTVFVSLADN